ncbi:MAG: CHAT domain-containing protein, partial [Acidobacteriota bacterium]
TLEGVYSAPEAVAGDLPRHGVYPTALASLLERGSPADYHQAFAYAEQALSKAMLRRLMLERLTVDPLAGETGETLAGEPLDPELERRRRQLEERLQRLQQQLDPSAETAPETLDLLAEARAEHEALIRLIRQRSPHFAALRYPVPLTADQARDLLDERTALVTYVPLLGDELAVFVLDRLTLEVVRLPAKPRELASRIAGYLELLARPEDDGWRAVSRDLHRQLFEPVRSRLSPGVESLILIVDRELAQLPFESLLAPAGGGIGDRGEERFLIEDFAVSYAPSATLLAELDRLADEQRPEELATLLAIGPPAVSPSSSGAPESSRRTWAAYELEGQAVEPLPGAAAEAVSVARYGGDGTVSRIGPAASESWLRQQPLEAFDVLHFATHGLLSPLSSARSALLLTGDAEEDGFLQAREISRLHLAADLVVLSACQTVERETPGGDGMQGIAESFFHAGAASVVGSLWQVTDQSSRRLMESFYRHLADGASKTMALRRAKLDALADAASRHPAHWAAFVLIGEGAGTLPLARPASWPRHLGLGILGLCVLGLTLGYLRR